MKSRTFKRTPEQQAFVDNILKRKKKQDLLKSTAHIKWISPTDTMTEEEKCNFYIQNCNWWINEYKEGRTDEIRLRSSLQNLYTHLLKLRQLKLITTPN